MQTWLLHLQVASFATYTHTHPFNGPFLGLPRWTGTRKVKPIWILLKQETVSGSGISWAICKSAPCSRQITTPAPHYSVFYLQCFDAVGWAAGSFATYTHTHTRLMAITAMIIVHRAQQNLHQCQKSTSSRHYWLTRLESTLSIDSTSALIDRLELCDLIH